MLAASLLHKDSGAIVAVLSGLNPNVILSLEFAEVVTLGVDSSLSLLFEL